MPARPETISNQKGSALLVTLAMLVILSIIGLMSLTTSNLEMSISGNYHTLRKAFYAADRAVNYTGANSDIYEASGTVDLGADATHRDNILIDDSGLDPNRTSRATFLMSGPPPVGKDGTGSDASLFDARYFLVEVNSAFPVNANNPSRAALEVQVARIVPK